MKTHSFKPPTQSLSFLTPRHLPCALLFIFLASTAIAADPKPVSTEDVRRQLNIVAAETDYFRQNHPEVIAAIHFGLVAHQSNPNASGVELAAMAKDFQKRLEEKSLFPDPSPGPGGTSDKASRFEWADTAGGLLSPAGDLLSIAYPEIKIGWQVVKGVTESATKIAKLVPPSAQEINEARITALGNHFGYLEAQRSLPNQILNGAFFQTDQSPAVRDFLAAMLVRDPNLNPEDLLNNDSALKNEPALRFVVDELKKQIASGAKNVQFDEDQLKKFAEDVAAKLQASSADTVDLLKQINAQQQDLIKYNTDTAAKQAVAQLVAQEKQDRQNTVLALKQAYHVGR